jgi:predicted AAA+ superfamily ATPase
MREIIVQKIVDSVAAPLPRFTRRDIFVPRVSAKKAYAVVGMRRAGKTTFLWQILSDALHAGMPREALLYFNFEDERLLPMSAADLSLVLEEYYRLYPAYRDRQRVIFCLDEIQVVNGWERFVRRLLDTEQIELYLSGSSARLLSRELATEMRGRALEVRVYPFSFREYLRHQGMEPSKAWELLTKAERSQIEQALWRYLQEGGFPEAVGTDARSRAELLRSYVDAAILRDVIERYQVSHPTALRWLTRQLLGNPGSLFSVNKFYHDLKAQGLHIGKERVYEYLHYLEDVFLVRTVALAAQSERRRMSNPRKAYPIDMGLIPLYARTIQPNIGHALETAVYLELERRGAEIHYVRTRNGYEVDFYALYPEGHAELIQVCADLSVESVRVRELRALQEASREYPHARALLITLAPIPSGITAEVPILPASQWLLQS